MLIPVPPCFYHSVLRLAAVTGRGHTAVRLHGRQGGTTMPNTITGTSGNDILNGTADDDLIFGLEGNDYLFGYGGNDTLSGGAGNDYMEGGVGADTFLFGAGDGFDIANLYLPDDRIRLVGLNAGDVTVTRGQTTLTLTVAGTGEQLQAGGGFTGMEAWRSTLEFADGT